MKVRHKTLGVEMVLADTYNFYPYYRTVGQSLIHKDDPNWELVEDQWEDVTHKYSAWKIIDSPSFLKLHDRMAQINGMHNGPAFIIEWKRS